MAISMSGISSGLDTDSIVAALVSTYSEEVTSLENEQTLLGWEQEAWQDVNSDIYSFYNTVSSLRFDSAYEQIVSTSNDTSVLNVTSGTSSVLGSQTAYVTSMASAAYITGGQLDADDGSTKVNDLLNLDEDATSSFEVKDASGELMGTVTIDANTTLDSIASQLSSYGLTASYDAANGRFFISSASTGTENQFTLEATDAAGEEILARLGLSEEGDASIQDATDAVMFLNGAEFTSSTNTFSINGMTFTASGVSEQNADGTYKSLTINTEVDYQGIYDTIKNLINEYSALVNQLDTLYNADDADGYDPLSDDEKASMTETEIEDWETYIKEGLLSGDSTINTVMYSVYSTMINGFSVNGSDMYLSDFGIGTLSYFAAADNEKHAYYIDGDSDSAYTSANEDKLMGMIASDPDTVIDFFTQLSQSLWTTLDTQMKSTDLSSVYKVYNDKQMQTDYDDYTTQITTAETKLSTWETYWYDKFTAMEVALATLSSTESAISSLFSM